ncbi:Solanesyl diphosphate synthase 1, chloroplastic [Linum perenne]
MSAAEQIFGAGGKRMELTTNHRRLAEIIEMIHTASLIHDDETVHQLYGTRVAVLAGDFMFAQSSWYLANLENLEVIKLISQVNMELYAFTFMHMPAKDQSSTKGAAIFSEVDSTIAKCMFEYGKNLGLSFQVIDDILDFTQSAEQLGKPAGSDLAKGILTAPAIFALEREPKLREIIESEFCEEGSLQEAIELVKRSEGIQRAQKLAREKADIAIQNLECLPQSTFRSALEQMVLYNLERIE